jgi:hypothetical protein
VLNAVWNPEALSLRTRERVGTAMAIGVVVWLLVTQIFVIRGNPYGLSSTADPYSEANVVRAAKHYAEHGFLTDAGLAHIVYGKRFPKDGWVLDLYRFPLPSGVYTRYPPLPELIAGVLEKTVGYYRLWAWRFVPVLFGLIATAYAFIAFRQVLDPMAAGVMVLLLSIIPMATSHLHGLHFQGYAHAALLIELALLVRILFSGRKPSTAHYLAFFGLGFLQGWLSFEYAFIVTGAAIPLALIAHANDCRVSVRTTLLIVAVSGAGFTVAHILHLLQVAAFYGSMSAALRDFSDRALYRFAGEAAMPYWQIVPITLLKYVEALWFSPNNQHFGALLALLTAVVLSDRMVRLEASGAIRRRRFTVSLLADQGVVLPVIVAYGVAALWLLVMPSHASIHRHIVPHIFFLAYFVLALLFVLRVFDTRVRLTANPYDVRSSKNLATLPTDLRHSLPVSSAENENGAMAYDR